MHIRRLLWALFPALGLTWVAGATDYPAHTSVEAHTLRQLREGRDTFRYATFGDEAFWGDTLRPAPGDRGRRTWLGRRPAALAVGLKVDVDALPRSLQRAIARGKVDLQDPANTLELLKLDAVVGVTGFFDDNGKFTSMGIQCALCHSTVDDSFAKGIGHRRDGWANRDLNIGAIVALAPRLESVAASAGHGRADGAHRAELLGSGKVRRRVVRRRQGVPARRQVRVRADPARLRSRGREPAHLDRLGWRLALERLRREPRDARQGHVLRSAAQRCHAFPGGGARGVRQCARRRGPDHAVAARACSSISSRWPRPRRPGAASTGPPPRVARRCSRQGELRALPRAAAVHRARLEHAHRRGNRHRRLSVRPRRRTSATARRRCAACGRTAPAATTTTGGLPRWRR